LRSYKEDAKSQTKENYDAAKEKLVQAVRAAQDKYETAKDNLSRYYDQFYNEVFNDYGKAKDLASRAKNEFSREEAQRVYASAKKNLRTTYNMVVEFGKGYLSTMKNLVESLKDYAMFYAAKAIGTTNQALDKTNEATHGGIDDLKEAAGSAYEQLQQQYETAKAKGSEFIEKAKIWLAEERDGDDLSRATVSDRIPTGHTEVKEHDEL